MRYLLFFIFCLDLPVAAADRVQSHESILNAIRQQIVSNLRQRPEPYELEIAPLSQRLQLPECNQPLEVFRQPGSRDVGHLSLGVRCNGTPAWTLYHRAYLRVFRDVLVLRRAARQGEVLGVGDFAVEKRDAAQLNGGSVNPEEVLNKPLSRSLAAGAVLHPEHFATIKLIRRNQLVAIRANRPGFEISMSGIALMDGERGQRIRVRNETSKRIVEGTVISEGAVDVQ